MKLQLLNHYNAYNIKLLSVQYGLASFQNIAMVTGGLYQAYTLIKIYHINHAHLVYMADIQPVVFRGLW